MNTTLTMVIVCAFAAIALVLFITLLSELLAKLSVRSVPEQALATTSSATSFRKSEPSSLPARYTSRLFRAIDYDVYDTPTYVRKAEAELVAQRNAAKNRNKRKNKSKS